MAIIEKLKREDICEFFDMRDLVFSKTIFGSSGIGFDSFGILPGIFNLEQECADNHWIIRDNGRIVAGIGSIPATMCIGDERIKVAKITGVATHLRELGKGYMSIIMNEVLAHNRKEGVVASFLMGERRRYQNFGYEKTGVAHEFTISAKNIRALPNQDEICLAEMMPDDTQSVAYAKQLYEQEVVHFQRETKFHTLLTHWYSTPYIAKNAQGKCVGYLVYTKKTKRVHEIYAESAELFEAMISAAVRTHGDITLTLPPWRTDYIRRMMRICEQFNIRHNGNWMVSDWETLVGALLKAKSTYVSLPDGQLSIGIDGYGTLEITVKDGAVSCVRSPKNKPDIAVDPFTAIRLLCGHGAPNYTTEIPAALILVVMAWFPLPLFCPYPDAA